MKYLFTSQKCVSERRGETLLARNSLKACFVSFYSGRFPGVAIGVEMTRRDNEFGWRTSCARRKRKNCLPCSPAHASSECTVNMNERNVAENTNTEPYLDTEYVTAIN